jgi:hypothetical protein
MSALAHGTAHASHPRPILTATLPKVSLTLNAAELLAVAAPEGRPQLTLRIGLPGRFVTAEIATKSLRKAQRAISEVGADNVALVLHGHLTTDDTIAEAGLSAQPKAVKQANQPPRNHPSATEQLT